MIILAIETSCDETAVAILKQRRGKRLAFDVLSHKLLSQATLHAEYGGVYPTLAKREHAKNITHLVALALDEAGLLVERVEEKQLTASLHTKLQELLFRETDLLGALTVLFEGIEKPNIDAIAVTSGPGLAPALYVGANFAQALAMVWNIPLYPVNHMEGHIIASLLKKDEFGYTVQEAKRPAVALLLSGGHTELVRITGKRDYTIIGKTLDDAVGEAFDKVARLFGLPYPGGPTISKLASKARTNNLIPKEYFILPRPMLHSKDLNFSMSGLKTSVLTKVKAHGPLSETDIETLSMEFENAVTDVVVLKTRHALYETRAESLIFGGGVSANTHLREALITLTSEEGCELFLPDFELSGDNGIMIGAAGLYQIACDAQGKKTLEVRGTWPLNEV